VTRLVEPTLFRKSSDPTGRTNPLSKPKVCDRMLSSFRETCFQKSPPQGPPDKKSFERVCVVSDDPLRRGSSRLKSRWVLFKKVVGSYSKKSYFFLWTRAIASGSAGTTLVGQTCKFANAGPHCSTLLLTLSFSSPTRVLSGVYSVSEVRSSDRANRRCATQ
jgi:hypothetical protein